MPKIHNWMPIDGGKCVIVADLPQEEGEHSLTLLSSAELQELRAEYPELTTYVKRSNGQIYKRIGDLNDAAVLWRKGPGAKHHILITPISTLAEDFEPLEPPFGPEGAH